MVSTNRHVAQTGKMAGKWVPCHARNCRIQTHISTAALKTAHKWLKQTTPNLKLSDLTETHVNRFLQHNPDPTTWGNPQTKTPTSWYNQAPSASPVPEPVNVDGVNYGNHTTAEEIARLQKADPRQVYQNGDCGVLANELWNLNPHVEDYFVLNTPGTDIWDSYHHVVKLEDGTYADSLGVWSEQTLLKEWRTLNPELTLIPWDDGNPTPDKDPTTPISNPELYTTITSIINRHFNN